MCAPLYVFVCEDVLFGNVGRRGCTCNAVHVGLSGCQNKCTKMKGGSLTLPRLASFPQFLFADPSKGSVL